METKEEKAILDEMLEPLLGTQLNLGSAFRAVNLAELISHMFCHTQSTLSVTPMQTKTLVHWHI